VADKEGGNDQTYQRVARRSQNDCPVHQLRPSRLGKDFRRGSVTVGGR
jgi:hypothetical protein